MAGAHGGLPPGCPTGLRAWPMRPVRHPGSLGGQRLPAVVLSRCGSNGEPVSSCCGASPSPGCRLAVSCGCNRAGSRTLQHLLNRSSSMSSGTSAEPGAAMAAEPFHCGLSLHSSARPAGLAVPRGCRRWACASSSRGNALALGQRAPPVPALPLLGSVGVSFLRQRPPYGKGPPRGGRLRWLRDGLRDGDPSIAIPVGCLPMGWLWRPGALPGWTRSCP